MTAPVDDPNGGRMARASIDRDGRCAFRGKLRRLTPTGLDSPRL